MVKLEELPQESDRDLLSINGEGSIYDDPSHITAILSPRIIDVNTMFAIDIFDLFKAVNFTRTKTGAAALFRSLVQPADSLELIIEKQDSLRELGNDREKREEVNSYLNMLAKREPFVHRYLFQCSYCQNEPHNLRFVDQYSLYRESTSFFKDMVDRVKDLSRLESPYVRGLVEDIRSFDGKRVFDLIKGPVYKTFNGLKTGKQVHIYTPRIKFTLRSFKPTLAIPYVTFFSLLLFEPIRILGALGAILYTPIMYGFPETFDRRYFVSPLKEIYKEDPNVGRGIDALGKLDELISFCEYSNAMGECMVLPTVTDASKHYFAAKKVRNPVLAKGNPDYVPNDVNLNGQKLTIITGANSGGKTTYCKTIAQIQLLSQIGCHVPAEEAEISIADRILYQAPVFDSIMDAEGRFGTELKRTRDIFLKTTPRSLVILDELAEATTYEEKMEISSFILNGFSSIGSSTILVTHNHELARRFQQEGKSQNIQVEFENRKPTYKLVPGISKQSHAELIAEKVGFSSKDIEEHLKKEGYLK